MALSAGIPRSSAQPDRQAENLHAIGVWLMLVALLVFAMIVLGGVTRLTGSGLSMVEWRPVTGWLPPLSLEGWEREFEAYRAFPEYQKINRGMSLAEFKQIYWFEYAHRLLGRIIGLAFALPFLVFLLRRAVPRVLVPRLVGLFILGGLQGAVGWFMVQSGLVDRPEVSHYRLAVHLGLAFLIFGALFWTALACLRGYPGNDAAAPPPPGRRRMRELRPGLLLLVLVSVQTLAGALVAGLNAGLIYNTWPLMDGQLVPSGIGMLSPWWLNVFENLALVQFQHRILAYLIVLVAIWLWLRARGTEASFSAGLVVAAVLFQVALGIVTLLMAVPVSLGAAHQGGAAVLLAVLLWHLFGVRHGHGATAAGAGVSRVQPG